MQVPENIDYIIKRIEGREDRWKSLYMATWGFSRQFLKPKYEGTTNWNKPMPRSLPASIMGQHISTPKQLYEILASGLMDRELTISHLEIMFSLTEALVKELHELLYPGKSINSDKRNELIAFLEGRKKYDRVTIPLLLPEEEKEFILAKETRNCFTHGGGRIDERWITACKESRGPSYISKVGSEIGDELTKNHDELFREVEKWHKIFVNIARRTRKLILSK